MSMIYSLCLGTEIEVENSEFYTPLTTSFFCSIKFQMNERITFVPHLSLNENSKFNIKGILLPFEIEGQDGVSAL